jgi:hypothetical protein
VYKVKNITDRNIEFADIMGTRIIIEPRKEIRSAYPAAFGYTNRLQIEEIIEKPNNKTTKEVDTNGNAG